MRQQFTATGRGFQRCALAASLVFTLGVLTGCAPIGPIPPEPERRGEETYVIGATDELVVSVWKNPELSVTVPVRADGMISVPLLDDVEAEGKTPEELKATITESLSTYISKPDVTIIVQEMNSKTVSVLGGVGRSGGLVPLRGDTRVLEVIAAMGGFTTWARKNQVRIIRREPEGLVEYRFNYKAYLDGKAPDSNFLVQPGDTIVVPD